MLYGTLGYNGHYHHHHRTRTITLDFECQLVLTTDANDIVVGAMFEGDFGSSLRLIALVTRMLKYWKKHTTQHMRM